ncbi:MAG: ATP synthase subunit I [Bryobacteraceae bacterium]|jgi:hypothetical protein
MPDELTYERAVRRIARFMAAIGALGTVAAFAAGGWRAGAGFLVGSLISGLSFLWLKGMVDGLGGARPRRRRVIVLAGRYLLLGAGGYVIFRFIPLSLPAVAAGVFVLTAAVFTEVAVEIAYARK